MKQLLVPVYHTIGDLLAQTAGHQKVIYVLGLRRSGNHAFINWMLHQQPGLVRFFNNLQALEVAQSACGRETRLNSSLSDLASHIIQGSTVCYSYEEKWLKDLLHLSKVKLNIKHECHFVIILRDPFNFFASRYGYGINTAAKSPFYRDAGERRRLVNLWKHHASFFLEAHNYQWHTINYNQWVLSREYREAIASKLSLEFSDKGYTEVTSYGKGSSFGDNTIHEPNGKARVLSRWQMFKNDPEFRAIFLDKDLWHLSEKIFGRLPGTEMLKTSMQNARA